MNETAYLYRPLKLPGILLILTFIAAYFVYDFIEQATQEIDRHYQQQLREADALYNEVSQLQQKVVAFNMLTKLVSYLISHVLIGSISLWG
ncbi:MAG: hypothetical protein B7Y29_07765 [Thiotrichales bacterium 16-46-22]|nr:MAG: hypothetical protein B7Y29_07765 [Thiotrichales bacterium 16-46-22]